MLQDTRTWKVAAVTAAEIQSTARSNYETLLLCAQIFEEENLNSS
jgi:hypothetical protein